MGKIIKYVHHNNEVCVDEELIGKHRDHCLCHKCALFTPTYRDANCVIANMLYALDVAFKLVTPVWECPQFKEWKEDENPTD